LREGLDDYDYMVLLENCIKNASPNQQKLVKEAQQLLNIGSDVFVNEQQYTKDPQVLIKHRQKMGWLLSEFNRIK
jgi:hypothetical protein